ncbi:Holliday junction branch migration protein RuvA [Gayadomonas joobiniege]|uniref:Holliday junction branch migration protein RuvA n=1 Tax=Gayadomonas joobiniege TaxID=1234606 RepID=UPI00036E74D1|nr:Holliday junction branch migration protein RuvA [Gayadomonas joobiniege]
MISRLSGQVIEKQPPECILDVNGVGYEIQLPMSSFYKLPELEQTAVVYTHQVIREDAHSLYGFHDRYHRDLFRELLKANGVGPKLALAILSAMDASEFISLVRSDAVTQLVKIPGVGKKTAERLLLEMKDRLAKWQQTATGVEPVNADAFDPVDDVSRADNEAIEALQALGYTQMQANKAVKKVAQPGMSNEQIIRLALKSML